MAVFTCTAAVQSSTSDRRVALWLAGPSALPLLRCSAVLSCSNSWSRSRTLCCGGLSYGCGGMVFILTYTIAALGQTVLYTLSGLSIGYCGPVLFQALRKLGVGRDALTGHFANKMVTKPIVDMRSIDRSCTAGGPPSFLRSLSVGHQCSDYCKPAPRSLKCFRGLDLSNGQGRETCPLLSAATARSPCRTPTFSYHAQSTIAGEAFPSLCHAMQAVWLDGSRRNPREP